MVPGPDPVPAEAAVRAVRRRTRAPKGYRIKLWADGFYHVYRGGECLDEVMSHTEAVRIAREDYAARRQKAQAERPAQ